MFYLTIIYYRYLNLEFCIHLSSNRVVTNYIAICNITKIFKVIYNILIMKNRFKNE